MILLLSLLVVNLFITAPSKFKLYYGILTTRSKIIPSIQLLALGLICGMGLKTSSDAWYRSSNRPVEVSCPTFLVRETSCTQTGERHYIILKDWVGFKVTLPDAEKHAKALLDKKLVQANDNVSVRSHCIWPKINTCHKTTSITRSH